LSVACADRNRHSVTPIIASDADADFRISDDDAVDVAERYVRGCRESLDAMEAGRLSSIFLTCSPRFWSCCPATELAKITSTTQMIVAVRETTGSILLSIDLSFI
jgi:hypothetical protein